MRAVVQRVRWAEVEADGDIHGRIAAGLLVYVGIAASDTPSEAARLAEKVAHLRIFPDAKSKMNLSVIDADGAVLVVSAFTVQADARRGRRPSFDSSASGEVAEPLVEKLVECIRDFGLTVETGRFAAYMHVTSVNDGPICILLDSRRVI